MQNKQKVLLGIIIRGFESQMGFIISSLCQQSRDDT